MTQNKDLQVKVKRAHAQLKKKDKEYEELLVSTAEFNGDPTGALRAMRSEKLLIKTLLARISQLEKENNSKAEEMKQIKSSSKYTRWAQMQDELADQTEEIQRLNYIIRAQREDFREDRTRIIQEYEAKVTKYKEKINGLDSMLVVARGEIEALAKDQLITHHHRQEAETKVSRLSQLCEENNIEVEDNPRESNPLITNTSMSGSSTNNANNDSVRLDDDIDNDLDYVDDHE